MSFASPGWLWALLLLPLVVGGELWLTARDRRRTAALVARPLWAHVVRRPAEAWRWLRLGLVVTGIAGVVLALARPQWGIVRERIEREGVDVVLVLDTSASMATEDVQPNRFFLARAALQSLVDRLPGDRFALVAFEGEAYPLVPLTLDADAIGMFLETLQPGDVPAPGTSLGAGLVKGIDMFVDKDRANKVMVLVSDGEDLEGDVDAAVRKAVRDHVVVHTVGVGTESGGPVPDFDRDGKRVGFKKDESGQVVISRLNPSTLETIARATGGQYVRVRGADSSLWQIASAIDGMEQKSLAREYSYRKKERYQLPLGVGLACLTLGLLLPLPRPRRRATASKESEATPSAARRAAALAILALLPAVAARAEDGKVVDEVLLRPQRSTAAGRREFTAGNDPKALADFEKAAGLRPADARTKFNLADGLYKTGKYDEAAELFKALGSSPRSPLAAASRFNLGNALFMKKDYPGAVQAYRGALDLLPGDTDTRRNLELALRAIEEQKKQQQQNKQDKNDKQNENPQNKQQSGEKNEKQQPQSAQGQQNQTPQSEQQKEQERFLKDTGMPKERAMQLLDALQQNEKQEQKKLLAAQRAAKKTGKDW